MIEQVISRLKITFFVVLFLSPVLVSTWSRALDRWLDSDHRFDALPGVQESVEASAELTMADF